MSGLCRRISIAPTPGNSSHAFEKRRSNLLRAIPRFGDSLSKLAHRAEELAKGIILPGLLFEELGFRYVGPIDGHSFEHLLGTLKNVLKLKGPTLLHVITKKGLGYEPAMKDPVWFHACPPFDRETGRPSKQASKPLTPPSPPTPCAAWRVRTAGSSPLQRRCAREPA